MRLIVFSAIMFGSATAANAFCFAPVGGMDEVARMSGQIEYLACVVSEQEKTIQRLDETISSLENSVNLLSLNVSRLAAR